MRCDGAAVVFVKALGLSGIVLLLGWQRGWNWKDLYVASEFLISGVVTSFLYAIVSALLGLGLGGVLVAARLSRNRLLSSLGMSFVFATQALPPLFVILAAYFFLPGIVGFRVAPGIAGIIALSVIASSYYCEAIRASITGVDRLQWDIGFATGLTRPSTFLKIIAPQAALASFSSVATATIIIFKLTALLYPIGIYDFFRSAILFNNRAMQPEMSYLMIGLFYYTVCHALVSFTKYLASRINVDVSQGMVQ